MRNLVRRKLPPVSSQIFAIATLIGACALAPISATAQSLPQLPSEVRYPLIYDEFFYFEPVDYSSSNHSGSAGSLFGENRWFEGSPTSSSLPASQPRRAWYAYLWPEQSQWIWTETSDPFSIQTSNTTAWPGYLTIQANPGSLPDHGDIGITSGFTGKTGIWYSVVQLDPHPQPTDAVSKHAPLWLQSSFVARNTDFPIFDNNPKEWSEIDFEIFNSEFPTAGWADRFGNLHFQVDLGVSWTNFNQFPRPPLRGWGNDGNGECRTGNGAGSGVRRANAVCFDFLTRGDVNAHFMVRLSESSVKFYIWAQDDFGTQPEFNWIYAESPEYPHFTPPHPQRASFTIGYKDPSTALAKAFGMKIDRFFYTPRTDLDIWDVKDHVDLLRSHLYQKFNAGKSAGDQIWRINTTNMDVNSPHHAGAGICPSSFDFTVEPFDHDVINKTVFLTRLTDASSQRQTTWSIRWQVFEKLPGKPFAQIADLVDRGYRYVHPNSLANIETLKFVVTYTDESGNYSGRCPGIDTTKTKTFYYSPALE